MENKYIICDKQVPNSVKVRALSEIQRLVSSAMHWKEKHEVSGIAPRGAIADTLNSGNCNEYCD